jgi:hypothetical protein
MCITSKLMEHQRICGTTTTQRQRPAAPIAGSNHDNARLSPYSRSTIGDRCAPSPCLLDKNDAAALDAPTMLMGRRCPQFQAKVERCHTKQRMDQCIGHMAQREAQDDDRGLVDSVGHGACGGHDVSQVIAQMSFFRLQNKYAGLKARAHTSWPRLLPDSRLLSCGPRHHQPTEPAWGCSARCLSARRYRSPLSISAVP